MPAKSTRVPLERATQAAPHTWDVGEWPEHVWPHEATRARWIVRAYRNDLLYHRALTRIGKRLVVIGEGWMRFLAAESAHVEDFASNNSKIKKAPPAVGAPPDTQR